MPIVQTTNPSTGTNFSTFASKGAQQPAVKVAPTQGLTWGLLNQRHDCYNDQHINKMKLLLSGKDITILSNSQKFIKQLRAESNNAYKDRLSFATYENNFGQIINDLGSLLFAKPIAIIKATDVDSPDTPGQDPDPNSPHMLLQQHFTLDDLTMDQFLKIKQEESNAIGCSYFGMDFKEDGITPYAYDIDACSVLDWEVDDTGRFTFLVLRDDCNIRNNVRQLRDTITTTFTVWTKDDQVQCEYYQITYPKNKEPEANSNVANIKINEANQQSTSFKDIPIIAFNTPDNLSAGSLVGNLQASLFARQTTFLFCLNRGINPLLVYTQGAELPANGDLSEINEDGDRGQLTLTTATARGAALLGPNDKLEWTGPDAGPYQVVQEQLQQDKNEMYRLMSSMSSIIGKDGLSSSQRSTSGIAKILDNAAKENLLTSYAKLVKRYAIQAFKLVFEALGQDNIEWQTKGMDNYRIIDQTELLAKVAALPTYQSNVPSLTSYQQVLIDVAYDMHPYTNPGTLNKIQEEIMSSTLSSNLDKTTSTKSRVAQPLDKPENADMSADDILTLGPAGQPMMPSGSHLQTGEHISWQIVYHTLQNDYPKKNLEWVKLVPWRGPVEVSAADIDFHGEENWKANQPGANGLDKVEKYKKIMSDKGFTAFNPVILANTPDNDERYTVIDGRHRVKAAQAVGLPILAYIADVGSMDKDTPHMQMHGNQLGSNSSAGGS